VIKKHEHGTPGIDERLEAAAKVAAAGYPLGFIIAPIIIYPNWEDQYRELIAGLKKRLGLAAENNITFELISHRFTARAKKRILEIFPSTTLPMDEGERKYKYGQFGYGKYVYPKEILQEMDLLFSGELERNFPGSRVEYLV